MAAVKAGDVERALKNRRADATLLLIYGPDAGLVSERCRTAAAAAVDDPADPFQLIRLDGDALADEPSRLVEEASTFGMFGGRRAIWVRPTGRNIAPAISACLDVALTDTLVVIEAGDLGKSSPLRAACEASPRALALPCYGDEGGNLAGLISDALKAHGLAIDEDARQLLGDSLGGDRLATRGEIEKLALYAHGRGTVTARDVEAVGSDVSALGLDALIDAAFTGDREGVDSGLISLSQHRDGSPILILGLRHALALLAGRARIDGGQDMAAALKSWWGLNRTRQSSVARQLGAWRQPQLAATVADLQAAILDGRRSPALAGVTAARVLMRIAERARQVAEARSRLHRASS